MPASDPATTWPAWLRDDVDARLGAPVTVSALPGSSGRDVLLLAGPVGRAVLKAAPGPREVHFYRRVAPVLDPGLTVPDVLGVDDGWLLLEHVDQPLPVERRLADAAVMHALAALHRSTGAASLLTDPYRPRWTPRATALAVEHLPPAGRHAAHEHLERLRLEAGRWLDGEVLVSADPEPDNWGVRPDGGLVLFDWDRAGLATPALDVALTVPGLPTRDQLELAATAYLDVQHRQHVHWTADDFTRGLAVVKAWSCVDLLASTAPQDHRADHVRRVVDELPTWLDGIP